MSSSKVFSEVTEAYNKNIASINEARNVFQKEVASFGELLLGHLHELEGRGSNKYRWETAKDWSTMKEGNWLSYVSGGQISLSIRPSQTKNFKRDSCFLYFEVCFDKDLARFIFRCRFENQNRANKNLDEKVIELVKADTTGLFVNNSHIKNNTAILFKRELESSLFASYEDIVNGVTSVCERAVDEIYPDAEYEKKVVEEPVVGETVGQAEQELGQPK